MRAPGPNPSPRRLRSPLWLVLVALVLLPVGGVGFLASREARARQGAAESASHVQDLTSAFVTLADLRSALVNEQLYALAGKLVSSGGVQVDPLVVAAVLGDDLGARSDVMAAAVDRAFQRAADVVLTESAAGAGLLDQRTADDIGAGYASLRELRARLRNGDATVDEASRSYGVFGNANTVGLDEMAAKLERAAGDLASGQELFRLVAAVNRHVALSQSMSAEITNASSLILGQILFGESDAKGQDLQSLRTEIVFAIARREVAIGELGEQLADEFLPDWQAARADPRVVSFEAALVAMGRGTEETSIDLAQLASDGLARLELHNAILPKLLGAVAADAENARSAAVQQRNEALLLLVLMTAGTLFAVTTAVAAVSRPLARLRARARDVRDGALDATGRVRGAIAEVYDIQLVFEEIVTKLRMIERQATSIVEGDLAADHVVATQPGPLGRSVQESLRRLGEVTARLQTSEALSNAIVDTAAEAIWTIDDHGLIQRANAAAEELTRLRPEDVIGQAFLGHITEHDRASVGHRMAHGDLDAVEARVRRADGSSVPVLLSSSEVRLGEHRWTTVIARDITERKELEDRLERNAATDPLTGLLNRRSAVAAVSDALERAKSSGLGVGVVFCDLDGFKRANDLYGHGIGDEVLREVANRFRQITREPEKLARLGGDEFIVVVGDVPGIEAPELLARRLLEGLRAPVIVGDRRVNVGASFGVAWSDGDGASSELLRDADVAMFTAKAIGGGHVQCFDAQLQEELRARLDIEAGLRRALASDELRFVFQPIVAAGSHALEGVEALVRWDRPGHGLVPPASFIPVAEQSELIVDIGRWGLLTAARHLAEWDQVLGPSDFYVTVNIGGAHLTRYDIVADVDAALRESGVAPHRLQIEITETQLVGDLETAAEAMRELVRRGVSVTIDDYGTGFTSISYLRTLPLRGIKIDRSFITQLSDQREFAMVESLVTLASLLELEVVAEGVETHEQMNMAEQIGCGSLQGFLVEPPMSPDAFVDWLHARRSAGRR